MKNFLFTVLLILSVCMRAANFDVNNTNDTGPGTLKFCISQANGTPGRDTITFNPSTNGNIITFWTEGIDITESVVIIGNGVLQTQVAGNFADTLFVIKNYADTIYFKDLWLSAGSPSIVSHYGLGSSLKFERCRLWNGTGTIYYRVMACCLCLIVIYQTAQVVISAAGKHSILSVALSIILPVALYT